jgi:hypothetical protein
MAEKHLTPSPIFLPYHGVFEELVGQVVTRVSIELWSVRLLFEKGELHIEGTWELVTPDGCKVDQNQDFHERQRFELWRVTGKEVLDCRFADEPFPNFSLDLTDHWCLHVTADDDGYEDWGLTSSGTWVVCNGANLTGFAESSRIQSESCD